MDENKEHLAIVQALISDNAEQAVQAMTRHIESAAMALEQELFDAEHIAADVKEDFLSARSTRASHLTGSNRGTAKPRKRHVATQ